MRQILITTLLLLAGIAALVPASGQASNHGVIEGTVTNGTTGEPVPDAQVTLSTFVLTDGTPELVDETTTTTDSNGNYRFDGLDPERPEAYTTSMSYLGTTYSSGMIRFEDGGSAEQSHDFTVYETTTDASLITVQSRGFVLAGISPDSGQLQLVDLYSFQLDGNNAFVAGDDSRSLEFPIPRNVEQVEPLPGFDFGNPTVEGTVMFASGPLQPGNSTASLGYRIRYTGDSLFLEFRNAYDTEQFRILIPAGASQVPEDLRPIGDNLEDAGTTEIGNQQYRVWVGTDVEAGDSIRFAFDNLPGSSVEPNTLSRTEPLVLSATAFAGAAAIILFVVYRRQLHLNRPGPVGPSATSSLESRRADLVTQLRELESARDAEEIDDDVYQQERREILEQLRHISRQSRGLDTEEA